MRKLRSFYRVTKLRNPNSLKAIFMFFCYLLFFSTTYAQGSGTLGDPFIISTPEQLRQFSIDFATKHVSVTTGKHWKLGSDIDMSTITDFQPIQNFGGVFDGDSYTISNLSGPEVNGFVRFLQKGGVIKNLTLNNITSVGIDGSWNPGGLVVGLYGLVQNCRVFGTVKAGFRSSMIGGIAAQMNGGRIEQCSFEGIIEGGRYTTNLGGIIGAFLSKSEMEQCAAKVEFKIPQTETNGRISAGGLVGFLKASSIIHSYSITNFTTERSDINMGGLTGATDTCWMMTGNYSILEKINGQYPCSFSYAGQVMGSLEKVFVNQANFYFSDSNDTKCRAVGWIANVGKIVNPELLIGRTAAQFRHPDMVTALNAISNVWEQDDPGKINDDFPLLRWQKKYHFVVTFDGNSGEGTMDPQIFEKGREKALNPNTFTKENQVIERWTTDLGGTGTAYTNKEVIKVTSNTTLYAQWRDKIPYTITFDKNGGQGSMTPQVFREITPQTITANTFTKDNYIFHSWNTQADGSGTAYTNEQSAEFTAETTLYAQWKFQVTFDKNGGEGTMTPQFFGENEEQKLNPNALQRDSYVFDSWNTQADGSGTAYTNEQSTQITANTTLYAQWKKFYKIIFHPNGGEGSMADQIFEEGVEQAIAPNTFIKTTSNLNHVWWAWNTAADGSGISYYGGQVLQITSDTELYAQWTYMIALINNFLTVQNSTNSTLFKTAQYSWFKDGVAFGGSGSYVETGSPIPAGVYTVKIRMEDNRTEDVVIEREFKTQPILTIYPNPLPRGSVLTIEITNEFEIADWQVLTIGGVPVVTKKKHSGNSIRVEGINNPGSYIIVVTLKNGKTITHSFIVT